MYVYIYHTHMADYSPSKNFEDESSSSIYCSSVVFAVAFYIRSRIIHFHLRTHVAKFVNTIAETGAASAENELFQHTRLHVHSWTRIHTLVQTTTHMNIRTRTHTHTHTHTPAVSRAYVFLSLSC